MSLDTIEENDPEAILVLVRLPNGKRLKKRFLMSNKVQV